MYKQGFSTLVLALSLVCAGIPAMAETLAPEYPPLNVQPEGKPSRYAFVAKLLEVSSGAKQVQASTDPQVIATYNEARKLFEQANTAADTAGINMYLNMAVGKMYSAIQASTPKKVSSDKFKQDYEQRLKSVDALSEAYQRIVQEKQAEEKGKLVMAQVAKHKSVAAELGAKSDFQAARTELDVGYNLIKSAIELLRGGDTLTRTLSFASAEEEYHYEKDRNDTHFMLVNLLVNSKLESKPQSFKDKIAQMVQEATEAQEVAESLAKKGKHKEAIAKLEESTSVLVKAIRMGGIFIPSA